MGTGEEISEELKTSGLPVPMEEVFKSVLTGVIDQWELSKPVDIMMANRMVNTFMNLKKVEQDIERHGTYFGSGKDIILNPLLAYKDKLEHNLMGFYKIFKAKNKKVDNGPKDFIDFLDTKKKKKNVKKK